MKMVEPKTDSHFCFQYDEVQRLLIDAKVSALNKTAQGDGSFTIDKVVLENNLLVEVGHFLQDSLLLNSKDSAVWKLALLWNLALQLNDIQKYFDCLGSLSWKKFRSSVACGVLGRTDTKGGR